MERIFIKIDLHLAGRAAIGERNCAPATVVSCGRMKFWARSKSSVWESVSLVSANWIMGTLDAL